MIKNMTIPFSVKTKSYKKPKNFFGFRKGGGISKKVEKLILNSAT
jgi:hypothetical protein